MAGKLRWKRHAAETGLRAVGAAPRGWDLHDGEECYASVYPNGGGWQRKQDGWYWVASSDRVAWVNKCREPVATPEEAKEAAMVYVKMELAKNGAPK